VVCGFLPPYDAVASRDLLLGRHYLWVTEGVERLLESDFLSGRSPVVFEGLVRTLCDLGVEDPPMLRWAIERGVNQVFETSAGSGRVLPSEQRTRVERLIRVVSAVAQVRLPAEEKEELLAEGLSGLLRPGAVGLLAAVTEAITGICPPAVPLALFRRMAEGVQGSDRDRRLLELHFWQRMLGPIPAGDLPFWDALVAEECMAQKADRSGDGWFLRLLLDAVTYHLLDGEHHPRLFAVLSRQRPGLVGVLASRVLAAIPDGARMEPALACVLDVAARSTEPGDPRSLHPLCLLVLGGGEKTSVHAALLRRRLLLGSDGKQLDARGVHVLRALELVKLRGGGDSSMAPWAAGQQRQNMGLLAEVLDARGRAAAQDACSGLLRVSEAVRNLCGTLHPLQSSPDARRSLAALSRAAAEVGRPVTAMRALLGAPGSTQPASADA
jgi:hypothetical protein